MTTSSDLHELRRRLYGGDLPGETGDIQLLRADVASIKESVNDLAGFYRTVKRIVVVGASVSTICVGVATVIGVLT